MTDYIIGVKELYKNLKNISKKTAKGESFVVVNRSSPIFDIHPHNRYPVRPEKRKLRASKTSLWEDFKDLQFSSLKGGKQDRNLSNNIDNVVYELK